MGKKILPYLALAAAVIVQTACGLASGQRYVPNPCDGHYTSDGEQMEYMAARGVFAPKGNPDAKYFMDFELCVDPAAAEQELMMGIELELSGLDSPVVDILTVDGQPFRLHEIELEEQHS